MKKVTTLVLMLCFILSGALCYANGAARTGNEKDWVPIPIEATEITGASGSDRSSSILPTLDGHVLTVVFNEYANQGGSSTNDNGWANNALGINNGGDWFITLDEVIIYD